MSRDLSFWRYNTTPKLKDQEVYEILSQGRFLNYVSVLPIEEIKNDFKSIFSSWEHDVSQRSFENGIESFELYLTEQFVRVDCYSLTNEHINNIIDIMLKYYCPVYDSTIDVRFE